MLRFTKNAAITISVPLLLVGVTGLAFGLLLAVPGSDGARWGIAIAVSGLGLGTALLCLFIQLDAMYTRRRYLYR